ncbi:hypothetical protein EUTSA_v10001131mg, partial [Eutrema salsugineum]
DSVCTPSLFNLVTPHAPPLPLGQLWTTTFHSMKLEDSPLKALVSKIESLFLMLYEIAYGKDIITFLLTILYVATIDTVASYFNLVTFLYICFFCSMTIPVYYLRFQEDIDSFFGKQKKMVVGVFKSSVLDKIPRAAKKE